MSKCPYLHRRGNVLYFRISIPSRLTSILKLSEFTISLQAQERKNAIPAIYKLAGGVKKLFLHLDLAMTKTNDLNYIFTAEEEADILKTVLEELDDEETKAIASLSKEAQRIIAGKESEARAAQRREKQGIIEAQANAFKAIQLQMTTNLPDLKQELVIGGQGAKISERRNKSPRLSVVRISQHDNLDKSKVAANKKTTADKWWNIFIELVGDKQAENLEQIDIDFFLEEVSFLPSHDTDSDLIDLTYKEKIALCKKNKTKTIAKKTFKSNYKTPIKEFVVYGYKNFRDDGFKKLVVDDSNQYDGNQEAGEHEQRPLSISEVDKLINNNVMLAYINNPLEVHNYWFVMLGLFSGARLNEICQLHPNKDIKQDNESGCWFFEVTEDDKNRDGIQEGEVNQFAKTSAAKRKVPIHQKLIDAGFLDYVLKRRNERASIIFPFKPRKQKDGVVRAGSNAGQEFTKYLKKIGLYDSTAKNKVSGMHALRKTFITEASDCIGNLFYKDEVDEVERFLSGLSKIKSIVGHETALRTKSGENVSMSAFYAKRRLEELKVGKVSKRKELIDSLDYGISFPILKS